jgi:two-component system, response regulator PdtaR
MQDLQPFSDKSVLVVEDDFIVAFDVQTMLEDRGALVLGPAATLTEARALLARQRPSLALLDVNLNGEYVFALADELLALEVPCLFTTAYADDERLFPPHLRCVPRITKPVLPDVLIAQVLRMMR